MDEETIADALDSAQERITSLQATVTRLSGREIRFLEVLSAAQPAVRRAAAEGATLQKGSRTHPRFATAQSGGQDLDNGKVADELNQMLKENNWT